MEISPQGEGHHTMPRPTPTSLDQAKQCPPSTWDNSSYAQRAKAAAETRRPVIRHYRTEPVRRDDRAEVYYNEKTPLEDYRSSSSTYASTVTTDEELEVHGEVEELEELEELVREVELEELDEVPPALEYPPLRHNIASPTSAVPSTPPEFADFFPSTRRLRIRHDDCSQDNDMNVRVDTEISSSSGRPRDLILFHLRLKDLQAREFSLRRYCRESGREVCHAKRKEQPTRPAIRRSLTNALNSLNPVADLSNDSGPPLKRYDSGYHESAETDGGLSKEHGSSPSITTLEFSNYAHVDVRKTGMRSAKKYEFEFWGNRYSWKRQTRTSPSGEQVSFHLYQNSGSKHTSRPKAVAHIVPDQITPYEAYEENRRKNWIPPCSMWISDTSILGGLTDVAE